MRNLYLALEEEHPDVRFVREGDFKTDVLRLSADGEFLMYLVDDDMFTRDFSVGEIMATLYARREAIGFSLRLGRNTTYCYPLNREQPLPEFSEIAPNVLEFSWTEGSSDFGYPLELASSIYRAGEFLPIARQLRFRNPNTFEARLAGNAARFASSHPRLLCYATSVAFCVPVNLVQTVSSNRAGGRPDLSAAALARKFHDGVRLKVEAYSGFVSRAAHEEVELEFEGVSQPRPGVSIVIPCYRQAEFLPQAIASVVHQSYQDWELIVVNDGSPDNASTVVREAAARYPDTAISLLETENRGLAAARNTGIEHARGWLVLPLDADDVLHPRMLEAGVAALVAHPDVSIAYTDYRRFGEDERVARTKPFNPERLYFRNQLAYCALYRRHVWADVGGYSSAMQWGYEDWDFWVNAVERGALGRRIALPLFFYRVRAGSMYSIARQRDGELRALIRARHPRIYSPWRRLIRPLRIAPAVVTSRVRGVAGWLAQIRLPIPRYRARRHTSITDYVEYTDFCERAAADDGVFATFRRHPSYTPVLEHVTREQGRSYLAQIQRATPSLLEAGLKSYRSSERIGSPALYEYPGIGPISPTTLRYVKVLSDLTRLFGDLSQMSIIEIGVGYGGQCKIIGDTHRFKSYTLVDLEPCLHLAERFLSSFSVDNVQFRTSDQLDESHSYDLVISNYAFSELARHVQDEYVQKIIRRSARGYMTVNFISRLFGVDSYSIGELLGLHPTAAYAVEEPQTHPDNLILVWGARRAEPLANPPGISIAGQSGRSDLQKPRTVEGGPFELGSPGVAALPSAPDGREPSGG